MKRFIKTTALALTAVISSVTLSSCSYLDELKETTGVYTDSTHEEVIFRNERYKRIVPEDVYQFIYNGYDIMYYRDGYLRDADVPILLSKEYGRSMSFLETKNSISHKDENPILIQVYPITNYNYEGSDKDSDNEDYQNVVSFYVREDKYDIYNKAFSKGDFGHYCADKKSTISDNTGFKYKDIVKTLVPEKYTDIINRTLSNDDTLKEVYKDVYTYTLTLTCCDENMLIQNDYIVKITKHNGEYYIQKYDMYEDSAYNVRFHKVTESDKAEISQMFSEYVVDGSNYDYDENDPEYNY